MPQHPAHRHPSAYGVGYPVHRVTEIRPWTNEHQAQFTDWTAACGATGTGSGRGPTGPLKDPFRALRAEMCKECWA